MEGLGAFRDNAAIFQDVDFTLPKGQSVAIVGSSGCGKTTLLNCVYGLENGARLIGSVTIAPRNVKKAYVMQDIGLFPWKTVKENLELPLALAKTPRRGRIIEELLDELEMAGLSSRYPFELSGGERQRVALGRALVGGAELVLMDEPFSSLDAITRERLQDAVSRLFETRGVTLILATHSIEEAAILGDNILVLGGEPTRVIGEFAYPDRRLEGARQKSSFFEVATEIRKRLASGA